MDIVSANKPGFVAILYQHIHDGRKGFAVFHSVFRGNAVDGNGIFRDFPTIGPDNVVFRLASVQPRDLDNVRVFRKVRVPFRGTIRDSGRFRVQE